MTSIGVAVVGSGMAGRSHVAGYRMASTMLGADLPEIRLVAVADVNEELARETAARYGYQRFESDWRRLLTADDVQAVSVVVANSLHREIVEALLGAGKHVLCEKPLAPTVADAQAMVAAADGTDLVAATGFTFRRSPAISAIRDRVHDGSIGAPLLFDGHYWCDYACDPQRPMSWRYKGGPGSGALADIGSHVIDVAEFICGPITGVRGAQLATFVDQRPLPVGLAIGHAATAVSDVYEPVENEDLATFTAVHGSGAVATLAVSRSTFGHTNSLAFEVYAERGAATFDLGRQSEFGFADTTSPADTSGFRQVLVGPEHPYITGGLPMDFPGVGYGQNDLFVFQARAFLEQISGVKNLPPCPSMADGLHNLQVQDAVVESAACGGGQVSVT